MALRKLHYTGWIPEKWLDELVEVVNSLQNGTGGVSTSDLEDMIEELIASEGYIKSTAVDTKITNATKDFITSSAVDTKITNATGSLATSAALTALTERVTALEAAATPSE